MNGIEGVEKVDVSWEEVRGVENSKLQVVLSLCCVYRNGEYRVIVYEATNLPHRTLPLFAQHGDEKENERERKSEQFSKAVL